jgi:hypothetical protein
MPFIIDTAKVDLNVEDAYKNAKGNTECVAFVQMAKLKGTGYVPGTSQWRKGKYVKDAGQGDIAKGTVIATFDETDKYPTERRHAAVYISHNDKGITVYDQWNSQKMVKQRTLYYKDSEVRAVDNGNFYWVVETEATVSAGLTEAQDANHFNAPVPPKVE